MRLSGIEYESYVDGPGIRLVIFTQGCFHQCPFCHNPGSWDINAGEEFSAKGLIRLIRSKKKRLRGVTFSGGEPFLQAGELADLGEAIHKEGLDIVTYTGFVFENLISIDDKDIQRLLFVSDILIDGLYIQALGDMELAFRGSSNQRIIDLRKTIREGCVVLWNGM